MMVVVVVVAALMIVVVEVVAAVVPFWLSALSQHNCHVKLTLTHV